MEKLNMNRMAKTIIRSSFLLMILVGFIYPFTVTGIAQVMLPEKANGSLLYNENNEAIGSSLIGQSFNSPSYFQGRVSSIDYDAMGSGSENYGPSNQDMIQRAIKSVETWNIENPDVPVEELPVDLITNSASGLDPHISPNAALAQVPRVIEETGIKKEMLIQLINEQTESRELGLFGEPRVNVLLLNLRLDELK